MAIIAITLASCNLFRILSPAPLPEERVFAAVLSRGSLGFGEAYIEEYWECEDMAGMFTRLLKARIDERLGTLARLKLLYDQLRSRALNLQSSKRAFRVAEQQGGWVKRVGNGC